jgi:hypothetical protein
MQFQQMDDRGDPVQSTDGSTTYKPFEIVATTSNNNKSTIITTTTELASSLVSSPHNTIPTTNLASKACQMNLHQDIKKVDLRQTRRGCCQEMIGCEARNEFKLYHHHHPQPNHTNNINNDGVTSTMNPVQFAYGIEKANCFCRICCSYVYFREFLH